MREYNNVVLTIQGKGKKQGTYAHRYAAIEFLTWLSPEFKLLVIKEWDDLRNRESSISKNIIIKIIDDKLAGLKNSLDKAYVKQKTFEQETENFFYDNLIFEYPSPCE